MLEAALVVYLAFETEIIRWFVLVPLIVDKKPVPYAFLRAIQVVKIVYCLLYDATLSLYDGCTQACRCVRSIQYMSITAIFGLQVYIAIAIICDVDVHGS